MSKLFIVPTPIGNLEDITLRAVRILKEVDFIVAEDTRKTGLLLKHLQIEKKKMFSHHQHNEHQSFENLTRMIGNGQMAALVCNAGTPVISDPGFLLVRSCIKQGIDVECLPGPTSIIPALVNSGLPANRFYFEGFLPHKKGRTKRLKELAELKNTIVLLESPNRLIKCLQHIATYFGETRNISVSREISKIYEETQRGTVTEMISYFSSKTIKGEFVLIIDGSKSESLT